MKRLAPLLALPVGLSALLSCGASATVFGLEESGLISSANKTELGSSIVSTGALANLQRLLFGADLSGPPSVEPIDCSGGGSSTRTFEVDEAPLGVVSTGDRVRVTFDGCVEGEVTYQGALVFSFDSVTGDPASDEVWDLSVSVEIEDFVRATADGQRLADGALDLSASRSAGDLAIFTTGSYVASVSNVLGTHERTIDDLELEWLYTAASGTASLTIEGEFRSDALPGVYTLTTVEPLVGAPFEIPDTGELKVTGSDDASLSLQVSAGQIVRLRLDTDGDGVIDEVESVPWNEL